ncbi:hypothetical protein JOC86_003844 [Bacillus pakistanensis]|uniref:Lipoprotein n=1 Tax=Rossellomorea pakistanensis TaxID=992288 RepID=A0ABS2NHD7_9BACI|nr:hypothetical protein [Bacillus pakistanensis]MBM7587271.1 hypothetical protein [Bacillus pakistanensis]
MKVFIKTGFILILCVCLVACGLGNEENKTQGAKENESEGKSDSESEVPTFTPLETDVIQKGEDVQNLESMDQFVEDSKAEKESEIRYVVFEPNSDVPMAVYTLKSRIDKEAGESWVEISRDWNYDQEGQDLIEPQQCSGVSKDMERGAYYLNECFHKWEVMLMPIGG